MTPDEVVARARELEGQEVLLTVRGMVEVNRDVSIAQEFIQVALPHPHQYEPVKIANTNRSVAGRDRECFSGHFPHIVDIQPAPMQIKKGQRYADAEGRLFEGDADGGLWELAAGYILAGEVWELDGLRPVRVVDA